MKQYITIFIILTILSGCAFNLQNNQTIPKPNINWSKDFTQKYLNNNKVNQIIAVQYTHKQTANVILYNKITNANKSAWQEVLRTTAYVGKTGIDKQKEGDNKTPTGDFKVLKAFGILPKPETKLDYINIDNNVYACEDVDNYNKIITDGNCKSGEHMIEYSPEYNYGFTIDFNESREFGKGSSIFFHLKGSKPFTAGCVAFDEKDMLILLKTLEKGARVVIDYAP